MSRRNKQATQAPTQESTWVIALVIALAAYLVAFFATALPGLTVRDGAGGPLRRIDLLRNVLLPDVFVVGWFDGFRPTAIVERTALVVAVATYLLVATAAGWLLLRVLRCDRRLTRLEAGLFAVGAGLNILSLFTLLSGLAGTLNRVWFGSVVGVETRKC